MPFFMVDLPVKVRQLIKVVRVALLRWYWKKKWLMHYLCNPTKNNIPSHLESLIWNLDLYTSMFENILMVVDLNILKRLIKVPTCYKNPDNPSCTDLILTSKPRKFKNSCVTETLQSDFHKMTVTALKNAISKTKTKSII